MSMRTRAGKKISLTNYEELLAVPTIEGASDIPLDQLHEFKGHPFHVVDDGAMDELVESIKAKGVLSPAIARKRPEGGFELISGHRRTHAARRAGLDKIPVFVKDYSDDEAVCIMVDSNIQRERILPSEKAFALKMKMDAMRKQGSRQDLTSRQNDGKLNSRTNKTSRQNGEKLTSGFVGQEFGMSSRQVDRYIRLTHLLPELLLLVDQEKIKVTNAVEISFLSVDVQKQVLAYIKNGHSLTKNIIMQLRNCDTDTTDSAEVDKILHGQTKPVEIRQIVLTNRELGKYFPNQVTEKEIKRQIIHLLDEWKARG